MTRPPSWCWWIQVQTLSNYWSRLPMVSKPWECPWSEMRTIFTTWMQLYCSSLWKIKSRQASVWLSAQVYRIIQSSLIYACRNSTGSLYMKAYMRDKSRSTQEVRPVYNLRRHRQAFHLLLSLFPGRIWISLPTSWCAQSSAVQQGSAQAVQAKGCTAAQWQASCKDITSFSRRRLLAPTSLTLDCSVWRCKVLARTR